MPSLTLRDIPEDQLEQLRTDAKWERRSLNSGILRRLELTHGPRSRRRSPEEIAARLKLMRDFTSQLPYDESATAEDFERIVAEGRP